MTTREAAKAFQAINDWGVGVRLPPIPPELIDEILYSARSNSWASPDPATRFG